MNRPAPATSCQAECSLTLRVMATSDLHMHLMPWDYAAGAPSETAGLARTASLIRQARAEAANTLLFDNGDFLHGNPLGDAITRQRLGAGRAPRGDHPIVTAMRRLGYDAITLGNHDFDHGAEYLGNVLGEVTFPVLASNLTLLPEPGAAGGPPAPFSVPFTILAREVADHEGGRHVLRIGLLGFLPPGPLPGLRGGPLRAEIRDIVETARVMVPHLRALGADLVIVLAHSGIGEAEHEAGMENAVVPLAGVPGIDAIVAGHAHQVFPAARDDWAGPVDPVRGRIHGVPVVAPGFWGSHLGLIDLDLVARARGGWRVRAARAQARPVARHLDGAPTSAPARPDPEINRLFGRLHAAEIARAQRPVGETRRRLHSHFATLAPAPALDVVHRAMAWHAARALAGTEAAGLPLVASTAPFRAGGIAGPDFFTDIAPGPITEHGLADLYPFPNDLVALRITGAELVEWLERAASVFARVHPGGPPRGLLAPGVPSYAFETVAGCGYEIDLAARARYTADGRLRDTGARRVRALSLAGRALAPDDALVLLTNSYRHEGGGRYPLPDRAPIELPGPRCVRELIRAYLAEAGPYDHAPWASWRLAPVPGGTVRLLAAPRALERAGPPPGLRLVPDPGLRPDGFRALRVVL